MLDWLTIWGVTSAAGLVFKPILEELAKDASKDYVKDFFKDCLKNVLHLPEANPLREVLGKALKEFLQLFQQELEYTGLTNTQIQQYIKPLAEFLRNKAVAEILGSAFNEDHQKLDIKLLVQIWTESSFPLLPTTFDWEQVTKQYLRKVKIISKESSKLQEILNAQNQSSNAENLRLIAGINSDFDLRKYREGLQERYSNLQLDSLDTSGCAYNELKLWKIFVPQNVRECHDFLPQAYEIPKEYQKQLREQINQSDIESIRIGFSR